MPVGKQFSGALAPGQYWEWSTYKWPRDWIVNWSVRPMPGQIGTVALRALAAESAPDGTLTYHLTVWNVGTGFVDFDAWYDYTVMPLAAHAAQTFAGSITTSAAASSGMSASGAAASSKTIFNPVRAVDPGSPPIGCSTLVSEPK